MARIIIHTHKRPFIHTTEKDERIAICMCGLSLAYPFCDGSHRMTADEDENAIYIYDSERRKLAKISVEDLRKV